MMKTAGVEKHFGYYECHRGRSSLGCPDFDCNDCQIAIKGMDKLKKVHIYPAFTAEKQLELIKLIANQAIEIWDFEDWRLGTNINGTTVCNQDFTQALAQLTTELIKSGELDKEKVREVLQ